MSEQTVLFNRTFAAANESRARYRLFCGGAGSGKSVNAAQDYILRLSDTACAGANLLVVRKTEAAPRSSSKTLVRQAASRIFGADAPRYWRVREEPMEMESRVTGARILFRGMLDKAQRERVKSVSFAVGKLTWIWCEEATELEAADLDILDDRLRGDLALVNPRLYYQITLTFNPVAADHWLKRRFWDAPASRDVFLHHSTYRDNAFVGAEYAARMARRAREDPDGYAVYGLGEWGEAKTGLILTRWRAAPISREIADYDGCWMAQDFGYNHADCLLLVGIRDGVLHVLRELYVRERDTAEIIELAASARFPRQLPMYCDSAEPDRIRMWKKAGWRAVAVVKEPGSVAAQIDFLKQHELIVNEDCRNVIDELRSWRWMTDPVSGATLDAPLALHDDAMAALRYATEPLRRVRPRRSFSKDALGV